ncbi:alkaline phosphatase family protein [Zobellia galactanivorans]|uniref:alkaline phosphatase PafA n=1 Tax=Zobellia galactanivorans (strain DSM 12802 / CCUG 47099 / CIP 106680 / NCIMB 13871 / Dsij) TaxID=63186 RepID=UPI0026E1E767|nr:alkaline phosphatase PafA [Zobellia galactanivorans]MDO6809390.1 alkaline phosphatase family protein [Zobellia galactanivorans]
MHKNYFIVFLSVFTLTFLPSNSLAQRKSKEQPVSDLRTEPKLVVGIIVDQMRYDYITRFWNHYGEGGFKRLVNEGFNCKNNHYNYAPTSTGPGHTSVYTGTTPAVHGIIGNNWYDKATETSVYCAGDPDYESVGTTSDAGKMSPHRMTVTTITDELRLHTQMRGKTIAVALKDRGAVLPGGHTANAAYWFSEGSWITSSYYMDKLPVWVEKFNAEKSVDAYKKPWKTLKNINEYVESASDYNAYEGKFKGEEFPVFPHDLPALWDNNGKYEMLKATPFGNSMTTDFALAALDAEALGSDDITDFLAVSFSSTDYVGHKFGVASKEVQDTYLRLDRDLERLFKELDRKVGKGEYTVFLSADHAAIEVPSYLKDKKIPADYVSWDAMKNDFAQFLEFNYGTTDIVKNFSNYQYFLDHDIINNLDLSVQEVQEAIAKEVLSYEGIDRTYTAYQMWQNDYTHGIPYILQNGYNQKRSGDVLVVLAPGIISYQKTGSTHGSPQIYDTHVPLLFYGAGIKQGSTVERTEIDDIAPTIAALLGVAFPSGTTGSPITQVLK